MVTDYPSFQKFIEAVNKNMDTLDYDIKRFSHDRLSIPYNPFTKEEYELFIQTDMAINLALLAQYHKWLMEQIGGNK